MWITFGFLVTTLHSFSRAWEGKSSTCTKLPVNIFTMTKAEVIKQTQVRIVASEALHKRLDTKLSNLEVDPFFYKKQNELFFLRVTYLLKNSKFNLDENLFLSATCFDYALEMLDYPDSSFKMPDSYQSFTPNTTCMFWISPPYLMKSIHKEHKDGPCECGCGRGCEFGSCYFWKKCVSPITAPYLELIIRNTSLWSLKNMCMAKVVELGLDQDCLPLSVQETIKAGPELGDMDGRTQRALEVLEKTLKNLKL